MENLTIEEILKQYEDNGTVFVLNDGKISYSGKEV